MSSPAATAKGQTEKSGCSTERSALRPQTDIARRFHPSRRYIIATHSLSAASSNCTTLKEQKNFCRGPSPIYWNRTRRRAESKSLPRLTNHNHTTRTAPAISAGGVANCKAPYLRFYVRVGLPDISCSRAALVAALFFLSKMADPGLSGGAPASQRRPPNSSIPIRFKNDRSLRAFWTWRRKRLVVRYEPTSSI